MFYQEKEKKNKKWIVNWRDDYELRKQNIFRDKEKAEKELESLESEGYDCWLSIENE